MSQGDPIRILGDDPALGPVVDRVGEVSLTTADDPFERLVTAVVRQQVSMDAAAAIRERLFDAVEVTPTGIQDADPGVLRDAGLSGAKVEYAKAIASAWEANGYSRAYFADHSDAAVVDELTGVRGVGDWTAKMFLMFCLGREDVFPVEDLGIRQGMWEFVDGDLTRGEMSDRASAWAPYRSYASLYLWRGVEGDL
jgi:DNA-3-methyladenine glycosylase II